MAYEFEVVEREGQPTLVVRTRAAVEELSRVLGPAWGSIMAYAGKEGAEPSGPPFVAYHNMDMQDLDLEIGLPFERPLPGDGEVRAGAIAAGTAVVTEHVGPYDRVGDAYEAMQAFLTDRGHVPAGPAYEHYLNDPAEVPPNELRTRIVMPVG